MLAPMEIFFKIFFLGGGHFYIRRFLDSLDNHHYLRKTLFFCAYNYQKSEDEWKSKTKINSKIVKIIYNYSLVTYTFFQEKKIILLENKKHLPMMTGGLWAKGAQIFQNGKFNHWKGKNISLIQGSKMLMKSLQS